jgi:cytochrome P450
MRSAFPLLITPLTGEQHRKQRKMLNPVFSMKHMRDLLPVFYPIAHRVGMPKCLRAAVADHIQ